MQPNSQPKRHIESIAVFGRVAKKNFHPQMTPIAAPFTRSRTKVTSKLYGNKVTVADGGDRTYTHTYPPDLQFFPMEDGEKVAGFSTQKPLSSAVYMIQTYTRPAELILDPCAGTGTALVAAIRADRRWIGIEAAENHFQIAWDRIAPHQTGAERPAGPLRCATLGKPSC